MRSSFPRGAAVGSLLWVPAAGVAGLVAYHCAGTYWFLYNFAWMLASLDGAQWRHPGTDQRRARLAGAAGATAAAVVTFSGFKYALDRILLPKAPSRTRLFDVLTADDASRGPVRLTPARAWALLGPGSDLASWRTFGRAHGWQAMSLFLSTMWCVLLVPLAHGRAEAAACELGEPKPPEQRQRMLAELQRRLDDARTGGRRGLADGAARAARAAVGGGVAGSDGAPAAAPTSAAVAPAGAGTPLPPQPAAPATGHG
jgi:hypothetical protein